MKLKEKCSAEADSQLGLKLCWLYEIVEMRWQIYMSKRSLTGSLHHPTRIT